MEFDFDDNGLDSLIAEKKEEIVKDTINEIRENAKTLIAENEDKKEVVQDVNACYEEYSKEDTDKELEESLKKVYKELIAEVVKRQTELRLIKLEVSFLSDYSVENDSGDTAGDHFTKQEKDEITNRLMPLIVKLATETSKTNKTLEYDDIFGACMEGFVKALNKYTKRNIPVAFSCYSVNSMKFATVDTTRRNTKKSRPVIGIYLDEEVDDETKQDSYSYVTTDDNANIIEKSVKKVQFDELLKKAGPELNPLEQKFLFYYYLSGEGLTIMEVAEKMRKKKSEVISIQSSAISKLRNVASNMGYANLTDFMA